MKNLTALPIEVAKKVTGYSEENHSKQTALQNFREMPISYGSVLLRKIHLAYIQALVNRVLVSSPTALPYFNQAIERKKYNEFGILELSGNEEQEIYTSFSNGKTSFNIGLKTLSLAMGYNVWDDIVASPSIELEVKKFAQYQSNYLRKYLDYYYSEFSSKTSPIDIIAVMNITK